ncbi:helix-turn-helix domain-containing protein [Acinetobacter sp. KS-LM10]|uniref:helix-turn-helix domain-containing protein n=1 Tax=Acinetobacter sp. KS-LM10 TaxID=3120518 RepID=UPI0030D0F332
MEVNPNSQQPSGSSLAPNALGNIQRPGEYLRQIRISQNCELSEVAKNLNVPLRILELLEEDEYTGLPEATFIKGYYRSYAKYLKVDATTIIQRFDEIYQNDTGLLPNHALNNSPIKIMGKLSGSNTERNRKWLKRILIGLLVIALVWLAIESIQKWTGKDSQKEANTAQANEVQVLTLDNGNASVVVPASGDQMTLAFTRPTSVHIVDSNGKVLATGRQSAPLSLTGDTPFQIRLDDAQAVSLSLNNESISLSPYTVNGKAEFRLSR